MITKSGLFRCKIKVRLSVRRVIPVIAVKRHFGRVMFKHNVYETAQRNDTYFMKSVVYGSCLNYFREIEILHLTCKT